MTLQDLRCFFLSIFCFQSILVFLPSPVLAESNLEDVPINTERIEHFSTKVLESEADFEKQFNDYLVQNVIPTPTETTNPPAAIPTPTPTETTTTPIPIPTGTSNPSAETDYHKWHFKIQPYAVIPVTTYGYSTVRGRTLDYQLSLADLLQVLRMTASGRIEAWHDNVGFIIDAYYASLNGGGIRQSNPPFQTSLQSTLTFDQGVYDFALSYHFGAPAVYSLPDKPSGKNFPLFSFEPIAGVQLNNISATINSTLSLGILNRTFQSTVTEGRTWFEPMVGAKIAMQVSDPVTLWVRGEVSGFGLAGQTDLSWNAIAGADWWVTKNISLQLGYDFFQLNYVNGTGNNAFGLNQSFNGPFLAATFSF